MAERQVPVSTRARSLRAAKLFEGLSEQSRTKCALTVAGILLEEVERPAVDIERALAGGTFDCAVNVIAGFLPPDKAVPIPQALLATVDDVAAAYGTKLTAQAAPQATPAQDRPTVVQTVGELDRAARWMTLPGNIKIPRHVTSDLSCLYPFHWVEMKTKSETNLVIECWRARASEFFGASTPVYLESKKKRIVDSLCLWLATVPPAPTAEHYKQFFCAIELLVELKLLVLFRATAATVFWEKVETCWNTTRELDYFAAITAAQNSGNEFRRQL